MVDTRSSQPQVARTFDLHSQTGIAQLLVAVRASLISSAEKNEFRDLVFQFSSSNGDAALLSMIERKIAEYQLEPPAPKEVPLPEPEPIPPPRALPFGSVRPRPVFIPVVSVVNTAVSPVIPPVVPVQVATIENPPHQAEVTASDSPASPSIFTPHTAPSVEEAPLVSPPLMESEVVVQSPVVSHPSMPEPSHEPVPSPLAGSPDLTEKNLNRIREIKALVNEKVGNPVNLVDINNAVGREYMSALLDAMKKINGGGAGVAAMERLETAYESVTEVIKNHPAEQKSPYQAVSPTVVSPIPTNIPPITLPVISDPVRSNSPDAPPVSVVVSEPPIFVPPPPVSEKLNPTPVSTIGQNELGARMPSPPPLERKVSPSAVAPITQTAPRPLTPMDLADPTSLESSSVMGDPLFTREVDDGLNQLLSEWSLFKKSGLFGTGPKGKEHPLFKKISSLQIPLLLAGRFEGATQEIKQSITDYMNGWRYEQGIIYEQGETFEHYLRRVIKHIIDLQKKRTTA